MSRKELLDKLENLPSDALRFRGSVQLCALFYWFFQDKVKEDYGPRSGLSILLYLSRYVVDAVALFSQGKDLPAHIGAIRDQYLREVEREEIPLLTEVGFGGVRRVLLITSISSMMAAVTQQKFVKEQIENYCFAQDHVLDQSLYRFLQEVGFRGLLDIYESSAGGCSGTFGQTEIRVLGSAGRLMITFARRREGKTTYEAPKDSGVEDLVLPYVEESVTIIGDDSHPEHPRWGVQSCHAPFRLALEMIEDGIANWPTDAKCQKEIFKEDKDVSIGM